LLANEAVAGQLMAKNIPAIYRVHEDPDPRRLNEYREDVLSHHVPAGNLTKRIEVQKLLEKLGTISIGPALKIGFLRSLMRARYAVEPLGHYGLAKKRYTHFTSPIRRYADLVVHRALFPSRSGDRPRETLAPGHPMDRRPAKRGESWGESVASPPSPRPGSPSLKETADHISDTERNSADAERDSKDVKLYAFLKAQLASGEPNVYPALVTDVRNFGFFVDVHGLAMSGLVHLSMLEDDFYVFEESRGHLIGRRTRRMIRLGDKVQVQVARVDSFKKQVDFRLAQPSSPIRYSPARRDEGGSKFRSQTRDPRSQTPGSRPQTQDARPRIPTSGRPPQRGGRSPQGRNQRSRNSQRRR